MNENEEQIMIFETSGRLINFLYNFGGNLSIIEDMSLDELNFPILVYLKINGFRIIYFEVIND